MRQKSTTLTSPSERLVKNIRASDAQAVIRPKSRSGLLLDGLRGESSIAELCRREGIAEGLYYSWSKEFLEGRPSAGWRATRRVRPRAAR